jgi:hypothetical protein
MWTANGIIIQTDESRTEWTGYAARCFGGGRILFFGLF